MTTQLELPNVPTPDNTLVTLLALAKSMTEKSERVETLTAEIATLTEDIKGLRERLIPDLMQSVGLTEFRMADGSVLSIKPVYYASVPKARAEQAYAWLRAHNMEGIIKESLSVDTGYKDRLIEAAVPFETSASIHPSTLRAFAKERIEAGDTEFPKELFGATVVQQAVLKAPQP